MASGPRQVVRPEVAIHCGDSETNAAARIRYLLAEKEPVVLGYDQARWAEALDYHSAPIEPALRAVEAARANTVALLRRLPEAAWAAAGTHTETGGPYTADDWLRVYAEHLEKHSRQVERNLEAWKART